MKAINIREHIQQLFKITEEYQIFIDGEVHFTSLWSLHSELIHLTSSARVDLSKSPFSLSCQFKHEIAFDINGTF